MFQGLREPRMDSNTYVLAVKYMLKDEISFSRRPRALECIQIHPIYH